MPLFTAKIINSPQENVWSFAYRSQKNIDQKGELVALFTIKKSIPVGGGSNEELQNKLVNKFEDLYFSNSGTVFESLKNAVSVLGEEFRGQFEFELISVAFWKDFLYLAKFGTTDVLVFKNNGLYQIFSKENYGVQIVSGHAHVGDIFLLGSKSFFEGNYKTDLELIFTKGNSTERITQMLAPKIEETHDPQNAVIIIEIREESSKKQNQEKVVQQQNGESERIWLLKPFLVALARKLPEKNKFLERGDPEIKRKFSKRTATVIGLSLLVILGVSVLLGLKQKSLREYRSGYQDQLTKAQNLLSDSLLQKDVNEEQARNSFREAQNIAEILKNQGIKDSDLDTLLANLQKNQALVLGQVNAQMSAFLDLAIIRSDIKGSELALEDGNLGILDKEGDRVILVDTENKKTTVFGGPDNTPGAQKLALYSNKTYLLTPKGILEVGKNGNAKTIIEKDDMWGNTVLNIASFGSNLYVLTQDNIWRYPASTSGNGFSAKQEWLGKAVNPNFSSAVDWSIGGSIWVASKDGRISKFTRGAPDSFRISRADVSNIDAVYTDDTLDSVYVMDRVNGRIIEFDKKGEYKLEYLAQEIKGADDFVVSGKKGSIFILANNRILETPLK